MPLPWEKYSQSETEPKSDGPWAKYERRGPTRTDLPPVVSQVQRPMKPFGNPTIGGAEALLTMGTGMVATPLNELMAAGAAAWPGGKTGDEFMQDPPIGTYRPRTMAGEAAVNTVNTAMTPVAAATEFLASPPKFGMGEAGQFTSQPDERNTEFGEHLIKALLGFLPARSLVSPRKSSVPSNLTPEAKVLSDAGVPLDLGQRTGGTLAGRARSAVSDHPLTAPAQERFRTTQQRAFNKAVLERIGETSDRALPEVMARAKDRIGSVFDEVGKDGALFDDALQSELATIVDDARAQVVESDLGPLLKNVDDLLNAVDETGRINGVKLKRIRSNLSELSRHPGVGPQAGAIEDALLGALERTYPGQKALLQQAVDQYRSLKIIENSISKDMQGDISPLALSNTLTQKRNRSMSVYGRGGDQQLVKLGRAGRDVLPEILPNSGTNPRGMASAPLRALATFPAYRALQARLHRQPGQRGLTRRALSQSLNLPAVEMATDPRRRVLAELLLEQK